MRKAVRLMVKRDNGDVDPSGDEEPTEEDWAGSRFQRRMWDLYSHFAPANRSIPVNFIGEGAFDFILSDEGLDLFTPPKPQSDWEYFRYYSFRQPGRPSIGVPLYLPETNRTYLLDTPTGPGQILSDPDRLVVGGCKLIEQPCFRWERISKAGPLSLQFTYINYLAVMATLRCWQIEGAVYRGILGELPRVIAQIWMERSSEFTGERTYSERFVFEPPEEEDVRDIFRERLETSLPDHDHMVFRVEDDTTNTLLTDVLITNQGFYLPAAPKETPGGETILSEIVHGRAGNPVFTDTKRPDGDE